MRTAITAFVLGVAVASAIPLAFGEDKSVPGGVSAAAWIPFSATAGFVVTGEGQSKQGGLSGYFMALRSGKWVRLDALNTVQTFGGQ